MFRAPLCPSSGTVDYTGCRLCVRVEGCCWATSLNPDA